MYRDYVPGSLLDAEVLSANLLESELHLDSIDPCRGAGLLTTLVVSKEQGNMTPMHPPTIYSRIPY